MFICTCYGILTYKFIVLVDLVIESRFNTFSQSFVKYIRDLHEDIHIKLIANYENNKLSVDVGMRYVQF